MQQYSSDVFEDADDAFAHVQSISAHALEQALMGRFAVVGVVTVVSFATKEGLMHKPVCVQTDKWWTDGSAMSCILGLSDQLCPSTVLPLDVREKDFDGGRVRGAVQVKEANVEAELGQVTCCHCCLKFGLVKDAASQLSLCVGVGG